MGEKLTEVKMSNCDEIISSALQNRFFPSPITLCTCVDHVCIGQVLNGKWKELLITKVIIASVYTNKIYMYFCFCSLMLDIINKKT